MRYDNPEYHPTAFYVVDDCVLYGSADEESETVQGIYTHGDLWHGLKNTIRDTRPGASITDKRVYMAQNYGVYILGNIGTIFEPENIHIIQASRRGVAYRPSGPGIFSGRFFGVGNGYISFWDDTTNVLSRLDLVKKFIESLGYDPGKVWWQASGEHNIVPLKKLSEFIKSGGNIMDSGVRDEWEAQKALHTQAGLKRLVGKEVPVKQLGDDDLPMAQLNFMRRIGDSVDLEVRKCYEVL